MPSFAKNMELCEIFAKNMELCEIFAKNMELCEVLTKIWNYMKFSQKYKIMS
jgi:hypothetical protein